MNEENKEASDLEIRVHALESVFGKSDETHLHGVIPFSLGYDMGGTADVISFSDHYQGAKLYVTCELVGNDDQRPNSKGQYELAVCHKEEEGWPVDLILNLAHYSLESAMDHGQTMDVDPATPQDSDISALIFKRIGEYDAFGKPANVICCIGITKKELDYCFENGSEALFSQLPERYILTEKNRKSFV